MPLPLLQSSFGMQMSGLNKANLSQQANVLTAPFEDTGGLEKAYRFETFGSLFFFFFS